MSRNTSNYAELPASNNPNVSPANETPMWTLNWTRIGATEGANVRDQQSSDAYSFVQIPEKWENPNKCRNALGLVGGAEVSHIKGNLIDLESDLYGITRPNSKCNAKQYVPSCPLGGGACPDYPADIQFRDKSTAEYKSVSTEPYHLKTCQTWSYPGTPVPKPYGKETCEIGRF